MSDSTLTYWKGEGFYNAYDEDPTSTEELTEWWHLLHDELYERGEMGTYHQQVDGSILIQRGFKASKAIKAVCDVFRILRAYSV